MVTMRGWVVAAVLLTGAGGLAAQNTATGDRSDSRASDTAVTERLVRAEAAGGAIRIDGTLAEPAWQTADVASGFVQQRPDDGGRASEETQVRVLLGDEHLYVGARLFDSSPDSIVARLARRDQEVYSDWFYVYIDSYHDRRTAFGFAVNAAGVELDQRASEEDRLDASWDAVWDAAVTTDDRGWVVEIEIPLSQLRFNDGAGRASTWGINFVRRLARRQELAYWAPVPQDANRFVSLFGELEGVSEISTPRRIEVTPYTVTRLTRAPGVPGDPFHDANATHTSVGGDVQVGIGGLTLSATINPDFGQVEADPSFINLTAFEVFQQERRPFFVEGDDIFRPSHPMWPPTFYSRRIGRRPQGQLPAEATFGDVPDATTILGAAKLSGKTEGGWLLGLLSAVTRREEGRFATPEGGFGRTTLEPRTHYGVARVAREFGDGSTSLGILATATHRELGGTGLDFLHRAAYAGGIDGFHRFGGGAYEVRFSASGSLVQGGRDALQRTQDAPGRYLSRPDAKHLGSDPNRTSLSGLRAGLQVRKSTGNWQFWSNADLVTSGYEINDLGFNTRLDEGLVWGQFGYNRFEPGSLFRNWSLNGAASTAYTLGSEPTRRFVETNTNFTLLNYWGGGFWVQRHFSGTFDVSGLRGGPAVAMDGRWAGGVWMNTDRRKAVSGRAFTFWEREDQTGDVQVNMDATVTIRPSERMDVVVGPTLSLRREVSQYIGTHEVQGQPLYLAGEIDQRTTSLSVRTDYTVSPDLSVQLWARPFLAAGSYSRFKELSAPRASRFEQRYREYGAESSPTGEPRDRRFAIDRDLDGTTDLEIRAPDFNSGSFQFNAVLRWEYRPGSTLFAVWSHDRSTFGRLPFDLFRDLGTLENATGRNVFALKLSYWLGA